MRSGGRSGRPAMPRWRTSRSARSRAAASATSVDTDAVSVSTPRQSSARPSSCRSQSRMQLLELGRRRRGAPQHPVDVERRRHGLGEDAGPGAGDGEVGVERRVVPVGDARQEDPVEVGQRRVERLAADPVADAGNAAATSPGATSDSTRPVTDTLEVVGDPVDDRVAVSPEAGGVHVADAELSGIEASGIERLRIRTRHPDPPPMEPSRPPSSSPPASSVPPSSVAGGSPGSVPGSPPGSVGSGPGSVGSAGPRSRRLSRRRERRWAAAWPERPVGPVRPGLA